MVAAVTTSPRRNQQGSLETSAKPTEVLWDSADGRKKLVLKNDSCSLWSRPPAQDIVSVAVAAHRTTATPVLRPVQHELCAYGSRRAVGQATRCKQERAHHTELGFDGLRRGGGVSRRLPAASTHPGSSDARWGRRRPTGLLWLRVRPGLRGRPRGALGRGCVSWTQSRPPLVSCASPGCERQPSGRPRAHALLQVMRKRRRAGPGLDSCARGDGGLGLRLCLSEAAGDGCRGSMHDWCRRGRSVRLCRGAASAHRRHLWPLRLADRSRGRRAARLLVGTIRCGVVQLRVCSRRSLSNEGHVRVCRPTMRRCRLSWLAL